MYFSLFFSALSGPIYNTMLDFNVADNKYDTKRDKENKGRVKEEVKERKKGGIAENLSYV